MQITYDPIKNQRNIAERGLSFDEAADLDWETAKIWQDVRNQYQEVRLIALARLNGRLHVVCFIKIPDGIRVISFRKANEREQKDYEQR